MTDPNAVAVARTILFDDPVYLGFNSASIGVNGRGYHQDNADRDNFEALDWQGRYILIRMGINLQYHSEQSGGLNLKVGSHSEPYVRNCRTVYADTAPGDLVVWNLQTSHSDNGVLLKFPKGLDVSPRLGTMKLQALIRQLNGEQAALVLTDALDNAHLQHYIPYLKTRPFMFAL